MIRAIFLAALFVATPAAAFDFQAEYGQCRFGIATNGTYYDEAYGHSVYLTPRCASVGIAGRMRSFWGATNTWGYRVSLLVSGSVESRDNQAPMNDGIYDPEPCSTEHFANCHSLFGGSGRMRGVQVTLTKQFPLRGQWWLQAEAGGLFFEHFFNGYAKPLDFDGTPMVTGGYVRGVSTRWESDGLNQSSSLWNQPLPMVGGSVGYGRAYLAARYHFSIPREGLSITDHSFLQVMGGITF